MPAHGEATLGVKRGKARLTTEAATKEGEVIARLGRARLTYAARGKQAAMLGLRSASVCPERYAAARRMPSACSTLRSRRRCDLYSKAGSGMASACAHARRPFTAKRGRQPNPRSLGTGGARRRVCCLWQACYQLLSSSPGAARPARMTRWGAGMLEMRWRCQGSGPDVGVGSVAATGVCGSEARTLDAAGSDHHRVQPGCGLHVPTKLPAARVSTRRPAGRARVKTH